MHRSSVGVSRTVDALVVVAALAASAFGGYFLTSGGPTTTTTVTSSGSATTSAVTSSAAGSASTTTSAPTQTSAAIIADLEAAAKAECAQVATCLTIYTTQDSGNWAEYYGPLFYQQFPWASGKVDYISWSASDLTTHILSDYQTKNFQADIVTGTLAPLIPAYRGGALLNYTSPMAKAMNYTSDAVGPAWVVEDLAPVDLVYNPTLLPASQVPKSWADLANPIYNGKLAFQSPSSLSITTAKFYYLYTVMGNSSGQWTSLMKGIAANHPMITSTAGAAESYVLNGQAAIGIDTLDSYVTAVKASPNVPLKLIDIEPTVYTPGVVGIASGAPHPNMAKLMEAWFISPEGQTGVYQTNHLPYTTSAGTGLTSYLPSDYKLVDAYSTYANTPLFQNTGAWSDTFRAIFGA